MLPQSGVARRMVFKRDGGVAYGVFVAKVRLKNEMFQRNPTRQINNTLRTLMHENSKNEYWKFGESQIGLWTELRYPVSAGERRGSATKYLNSLANEVTAELTAE